MSSSNLRQPACRIPLIPNLARAGALGVIGLSCRLQCWVERPNLPPKLVEFRVDSGSSYSFMNLKDALSFGLMTEQTRPKVEDEVNLNLKTAAGNQTQRFRPGHTRCWWNAALQGDPFDWPILFRIPPCLDIPPVLGLGGVVVLCHWAFDGRSSPDFPYGSLILEDTRK